MSELLTLGRVRLVADTGEPAAGAVQPKRVALLAYLALSTGRAPVRRDALLALFWPELGEEEGRRALRQALHYLRRVMGSDVFVATGDELAVSTGGLRCDAVAFDELVETGRPAEALRLYHGDFLTGFHVDDVAPELEEWVERTRARLRRRASSAAWIAADAAAGAGNAETAVELGRRGCELEPDQESGWRRLMVLQDGLGDRAGALRTYEELATRIDREFGVEPAPETAALAERIKVGRPAPAAAVAAPAPGTSPHAEPLRPLEHASGSSPADGPVSTGVRARTPHSRRVTMAAGILAGITLLAGAVAYIRLAERDDGPSLLATGSLAQRDRLIVADFTNLAGDSTLAAAVTEAFRVDLAQSPLVRVLTPRQVAAALTRMQLPPTTVIDDSVARDVAVREGAKAIVLGSVSKVGGAYTVGIQLVATQGGDPLAAIRETAPDSSGLIAAIDRASKALRHRIGESLREMRDMPRLDEATTASLPALRKYTEAQQLTLLGRRPEAIARYEEAVALDTAFATSWVSLGMAYASLAENGRATDALRRSIVHQKRLPFLERAFAVGSYSTARRDYDTAIDAYTRVIERYPDNVRAINNLALIYHERRQYAVAESLFARAAAIDSTIANFYFGIHGNQVMQGKFAESRRTLDYIARRFPGNPVTLTIETQDAAAQQRWEDTERRAETNIASLQGDTLALIDPFEALAGTAMTQGRLAEAERHWRTQLALSAAAESHGRHLFGLIQLAYLELRHRKSPARALELVDSALQKMPLDSVLPGDRPYDELARFYAVAGRVPRARELMASADANDRTLDRTLAADRAWTRGVILLADGRPAEAVAALRAAADGIVCPICALPDLARAYVAAGKPDAAVPVYERYLTTPWLWRYEPDAAELGWAMKQLAELYDARAESAKAATTRERLLQLWRRADRELQPVIAETRARLVPGS